MDSANKPEEALADKLDAGLEVAGTVDTDPQASDERRQHPDSKVRDRRVILRLGHPEMRAYFKYISIICIAWVGLSAAFIVAMIVGNLSIGKIATGRSLFFSVVAILVAVSVYRLERSVRSYLNSESQGKLVTVVERLFLLLLITLIVGAVVGGAYLITLF